MSQQTADLKVNPSKGIIRLGPLAVYRRFLAECQLRLEDLPSNVLWGSITQKNPRVTVQGSLQLPPACERPA